MTITTPASQSSSEAILCAVIGNPVSHSRSPAIHQQFALQTKLPVQYNRLPAELDQFVPTVTRFFAEGGKGGVELAETVLSVIDAPSLVNEANEATAYPFLQSCFGGLHRPRP